MFLRICSLVVSFYNITFPPLYLGNGTFISFFGDIIQATGTQLGVVCQSVFGVLVALVIAFGFGPLLALLVLAFIPLVAAAGALQMRVVMGNARNDKKAMEAASKVRMSRDLRHFGIYINNHLNTLTHINMHTYDIVQYH